MPPFDARGDLCVGFWAEMLAAYPQLLPLPDGAAVLEVGSADVDWMASMHALRPDLHLTGIDLRATPVLKPGYRRIQGDVLTHPFLAGSFDAAVAISTVEHIGLPMYSDPDIEDGDTRLMVKLSHWVAPGGWCYLDVPYRPDGRHHVKKQNFRVYDPETIVSRLILPPWRERARQLMGVDAHIDGPYLALILERA